MRRAALLLAALALAGRLAAQEPAFDAEAVDLGGLEARSAALMLSGQEGGDLGVAVAAIPAPPREPGGASPVLLVFDLPGPPLLAAFDGAADRLLEVYVYALDAGGALRATLTRAVDLDLPDRPRLDDRLAAAGVKLFARLDLPPGEASFRVLALHRASGRLGLRTVRLAVPDWSGGGATLLPPVLREPAGGWVLVREAGREPPPFPLLVAGEPQVPSAARALTAGRPAAVFLFGRGLGDRLVLRLAGDRRLELELAGLVPVALGDLGLEAVATTIEAAGLAPGEVEVRLSAGGSRSSGVIWTLRAAESEATAEAPPPAPPPPRAGRGERGEAERRIAEAYGAVATALAAGDDEEGRRRLADLHAGELGSGSSEERERLLRAELAAAAALTAGRPEALLPLVVLHLDLQHRHHRERRYGLATHARLAGTALADLYLARSEADEAAELVAALLVGHAVHLQEVGDVAAAELVHERALEVRRDHPAALIGLGTIHEARGNLDRAAGLFARLVEADPADPEARLHHAVVLRRLGRGAAAEEALRGLLAVPGQRWIEVVAAQELAGLLATRGETERAVAVLEAAVEAHPGRGGLRIQLAALEDRAGRPGRAFDALAALAAANGDAGPAPRWLYSEMPRRRAEEDRRRLAAAVAERREDLGAAADTARTAAEGEAR